MSTLLLICEFHWYRIRNVDEAFFFCRRMHRFELCASALVTNNFLLLARSESVNVLLIGLESANTLLISLELVYC